MSRKKRKKRSPAIVSYKKGLACLGLICAVQMLPQTVLADGSAAQVSTKDSAAQTELTGSAGQVDPAGAAAQIELTEATGQIDPADAAAPNNTADSAEISESLAYWLDPLSGAIFEDGAGVKALTWEDVLVSPLGHDWGEPVYTWSGDNSGVTAKSICRRAADHVLEESVDTACDCDAGAGKITWTAQFENEIFTTQTRSADAGPVCDDADGGKESRQPMAGNPGVRTCAVKKTSAAPAAKNSDTNVIHPAPVPTGDDAEPALWYTLFAQALACIAAVFTLYRRRRRAPGSLTDRADSGCRR